MGCAAVLRRNKPQIPWSAAMVKRDALAFVGGFDEPHTAARRASISWLTSCIRPWRGWAGTPPRPLSGQLRSHGALVLPSSPPGAGIEDASPLAVHEAQAHVVPVIAACWAGIPEVVTHGESGFLLDTRVAPLQPHVATTTFGETDRTPSGSRGAHRLVRLASFVDAATARADEDRRAAMGAAARRLECARWQGKSVTVRDIICRTLVVGPESAVVHVRANVAVRLDSPPLECEAGNPWEAPHVASGDLEPNDQSRDGNLQVVNSYRPAHGEQHRPHPSVFACDGGIEVHDRQPGQVILEKRAALFRAGGGVGSLDALVELGDGYGGYAKLLLSAHRQGGLQVQLPAFRRDDDAGIDQRSQGEDSSAIDGWER
jgi:hypothetical protein